MTFTIELERKEDGRWLAAIGNLPGVMLVGLRSIAMTYGIANAHKQRGTEK